MIEAFNNLTAEQWLANVILPMGVGVALIIIGVVAPKFPLLVRTGTVWLMGTIGAAWFTASLRLRRLFMTKKQKQRESELHQRIMQSLDRQQVRDAERGKELMDRVRRIQFPGIR